ncbi:VCBS repeat-containing protein, partial [bacterium]|nr:VCBS repeat-containing protein [bacterium]
MLAVLFTILIAIPNTSRAAITWNSVGDVGSGLGVTFNDVAHGDLNGDGRIDLVAASSNGVYVWLQQLEWDCAAETWGWAFTDSATLLTGSSGNYYNVEVADINNDGVMDVVSGRATFFDSFINSDGKGTSWTKTEVFTGGGWDPFQISIVDADGDGWEDVFFVTINSRVMTFLGDGSGGFVDEGSTFTINEKYATDILLRDINHDGKIEAVISLKESPVDYNDASLRHIERNAANNGWTAKTPIVPFSIAAPLTAGKNNTGNWQGLDLADVDRDGLDDVIAVTGQDDGDNSFDAVIVGGEPVAGVYVYYATAAGGWSEAAFHPITTSTYLAVKSGDINNDGYPDIIASEFNGGIDSWLGGAGGSWTVDTSPVAIGTYNRLTLFDYDNDANADIAATDGTSIKIFKQGITVNNVGWRDLGYPEDSGSFRSVAYADFNHDGNPDIVATENTGNGVHLWYGDGSSSWTAGTPIIASGTYHGVTVGDYNRDGNIDVAAASTGGSVFVWYGDGVTGWAAQATDTLGAGGY